VEEKLKQGELLFSQGKIQEAERCFLEVVDDDSENKDAYNNLGVISFRQQDVPEAIDYFTKVLSLDPLHIDGNLNYAAALKSLNLLPEIVPIVRHAIQYFPDDLDLRRVLNEASIQQDPPRKIAVLCLPGLQTFLTDIVEFLETKYSVRTCYSSNQQEIAAAISWADIVWLEWANEMAISTTNNPKLIKGKRVICRLHSYEALDGYVKSVRWECVDDLVFVAEHIRGIVTQQIPDLLQKVKNVHVISNGVNLNKFAHKERRRGKNLAYLGYINHKKGPMLLFHAFRELPKVRQQPQPHMV